MKTEKTVQENIIIKNDLQTKKLHHFNILRDQNNSSYIDEFKLFTTHFGYIPNLLSGKQIDCKKARKWLEENYKNEIKDSLFSKMNLGNKKFEIDDVFYFLHEDMLVYFDTNCSRIRILFKRTEVEKVNQIFDEITKFKVRKTHQKSEIQLLINGFRGFETESMEIKRPKLNIEDNYNDDFFPIHKIIHKRLSKQKDKGLVLLHGKPGTGKTSYIRYLISSVKKNVIFLPPNLAASITDPGLFSVLIENPNSVFVIEDAENIIMNREQNGVSPVSALLNLSDGLLSDCLNIQIVCSFNTDLSRVDSALLRKGRLIAKYEFKELETEKAQKLSDKIGFQTKITKPMTLTDIYNQEDISFLPEKRKVIGF